MLRKWRDSRLLVKNIEIRGIENKLIIQIREFN